MEKERAESLGSEKTKEEEKEGERERDREKRGKDSEKRERGRERERLNAANERGIGRIITHGLFHKSI